MAWLRGGRVVRVGVPVLALLLAAGPAGPAGGVGAAMVACLVHGRLRSRRRERALGGLLRSLADGLGVLVGQLRAGAHPAIAADAAAADTAGQAGPLFAAAAAATRLGGDPAAALRAAAGASPTGGGVSAAVAVLADAWELSLTLGATSADLLDAVRVDLDQRARFLQQVQARMAGPRASAAVLACLPGLGLLLGQGIGARPWTVLTATTPGQVLLLVGTALSCAGVWLSDRLVGRVTPW
jgi:tight adherence protein B